MEMSPQERDLHAIGEEAKLLTFQCGAQEYGIPIDDAREVVGILDIDPVPMTPAYVKGVMNLRGKIVPVVSLRAKLDMEQVENTAETCVVVVDLDGEQTGVIVDFLIGVISIEPSQLEDSPDLGSHVHNDYISGIAKLEKRVILILDLRILLALEVNPALKV